MRHNDILLYNFASIIIIIILAWQGAPQDVTAAPSQPSPENVAAAAHNSNGHTARYRNQPAASDLLNELPQHQIKLIDDLCLYYSRLPDGRIVNHMILQAAEPLDPSNHRLNSLANGAKVFINTRGRTAAVKQVGADGQTVPLWYSGVDGELEYPGLLLDDAKNKAPYVDKTPKVYEVVLIYDDGSALVKRRIDVFGNDKNGSASLHKGMPKTIYREHCILNGITNIHQAITTGDRILLRGEEVYNGTQAGPTGEVFLPPYAYRLLRRSVILPYTPPTRSVRIDDEDVTVYQFDTMCFDNPSMKMTAGELAVAIWKGDTSLGTFRIAKDGLVFNHIKLNFKTKYIPTPESR